MIAKEKPVFTKHYPLRDLLGNEHIQGDVVFNMGGFDISAIYVIMNDASLNLQQGNHIKYEEFSVTTRPYPWLQLYMPNIEDLPYTEGEYANYCELSLIDVNAKLVVFKCPIFTRDAEQKIEKAITIYKKGHVIDSKDSFVFGYSNHDWPWCKILLTNIKQVIKSFKEQSNDRNI